MLLTSKKKFTKYYENIFNLLHSESCNEKEYKLVVFNKQYNIKFEYSLSHSSLFINNFEIYIYDRSSKLDFKTNFKANKIIQFKKYENFTYDQLLFLFKKIKKSLIFP